MSLAEARKQMKGATPRDDSSPLALARRQAITSPPARKSGLAEARKRLLEGAPPEGGGEPPASATTSPRPSRMGAALTGARRALKTLDAAPSPRSTPPKPLGPAAKPFSKPAEQPFLYAKESGGIRYVAGVVMEPERADGQGAVASAGVIRASAKNWEAAYRVQRKSLAGGGATLAQSFIAPIDMTIHGREVRKGSWVLGAIVIDQALWAAIEGGKLKGWNIAGFSTGVPL